MSDKINLTESQWTETEWAYSLHVVCPTEEGEIRQERNFAKLTETINMLCYVKYLWTRSLLKTMQFVPQTAF